MAAKNKTERQAHVLRKGKGAVRVAHGGKGKSWAGRRRWARGRREGLAVGPDESGGEVGRVEFGPRRKRD